MVYFCYIDESGTPGIPGNTRHYVLAGLSIPIKKWKKCEQQISRIKEKFQLGNVEIHTGWMLRKYVEQSQIPDFALLNYDQRRYEVQKLRNADILRLQKANNPQHYKQTKKNHRHTEAYIHLTHSERVDCINKLAELIGSWGFARIFAECIDKVHFDPNRARQTVDEQALEQVVSRFEQYLKIISKSNKCDFLGTLIHDNNETVAKKHTELMKKFHLHGTLWTSIDHIIETPFFVNSELTSMVQLADLIAYVLRRYFENSETTLLQSISRRIDMKHGKIVGVRHFAGSSCSCMFCH